MLASNHAVWFVPAAITYSGGGARGRGGAIEIVLARAIG